MDVRVLPKPANSLTATRLVQQTTFWGRVKKNLGWRVLAFDIEADGASSGDVLILLHDVGGGRSIAYSPFGPENLPDTDRRGEYLAALSSELKRNLGPHCLFMRWDLPWISPYAGNEDRYDSEGWWLGPPETRLRELRMNWGVSYDLFGGTLIHRQGAWDYPYDEKAYSIYLAGESACGSFHE